MTYVIWGLIVVAAVYVADMMFYVRRKQRDQGWTYRKIAERDRAHRRPDLS